MILSDQQFKVIRQECPCFYTMGLDEPRCTSTGEAKCFAARCPFLYWDKVVAKHELKIQNKDWISILERLNKLENYNQLQLLDKKKESPWAFTDDRGEQPAHYTKEYLLEILDCYKRLSGIDKSFESARKCHEHDHNRLMQTLDKKNEEIETLKVTIEKQNASLWEWADKYSEREKDWTAMLLKRENIIDELKEKKNHEIKTLREALNRADTKIAAIVHITQAKDIHACGGVSAGASSTPLSRDYPDNCKKELLTNDPNTNQSDPKEETIKYHPV